MTVGVVVLMDWKTRRKTDRLAPYEIRTWLVLCRSLAGLPRRVNRKLELLLHSTGMRWVPIALAADGQKGDAVACDRQALAGFRQGPGKGNVVESRRYLSLHAWADHWPECGQA